MTAPHPPTRAHLALKTLGWMALLTSSLVTTGCVAPPKPLYSWGSYQKQVYEHFKGQNTGPEAQVQALEADFQKIRANGSTPPPGFHAHLGLLYSTLGKDDQAFQQLQTEKGLFPESTQYIEFLLAKVKK